MLQMRLEVLVVAIGYSASVVEDFVSLSLMGDEGLLGCLNL